jgi:hypothetical protein
MIELNSTYKIEGSDTKITFSQNKDKTISGIYNDGTVNGTLEGNTLKATFHNEIENIDGLMEITFHQNGFDAKWKTGIEPGPMRGKWTGLLGEVPSSEIQNDASMKKAHYMTIYLDQDSEGNELASSENAADFIYEKINTINNFIKDNIDNEVHGFLFEEFLTSFDSIDNKSINSPDILDFIKNKLKTDLIKEALESDPSFRFAFIFDPKVDELEIWKSEFLELSALLENTLRIFGYHSEYEDIVLQAYDNGDYDTGIIACDLEVFENLTLSDYKKSESDNGFPKDSLFELSNYSL